MYLYEVGKPFPGPIPQQDGAHFELGPDGNMDLIIQFSSPSDQEKKALKAGFNRYAYYEHPGNVPLACWVFQFPAPVRYIDAPFHAGLYQDDRAHKFLAGDTNALSLFILDGDLLSVLRYSGFQPAAMKLFRDTVRRQIDKHITRIQYNTAVDSLYNVPSDEIFRRGHYFAHKEINS